MGIEDYEFIEVPPVVDDNGNVHIEDWLFELTCGACPEQYDVRYGGEQVGYVRLRWGNLTCSFPDVSGEIVYQADVGDSGLDGCFDDDEQRLHHLNKIKEAISEKLER